MISLLIATKNRPLALLACLKSVERSHFRRLEIVIIDQSEKIDDEVAAYVGSHPRIHLFRVRGSGKSRALQHGLSKTKSEIVAFTDDDCLITPQWLRTMDRAFKNPKIDAVFGQTLPYEPDKHRGKICPCISVFSRREFVTRPQYHVQIGYGNNMALRRHALIQIGGFRPWLGPGSVGSAGEDADVILRLLLAGKSVVRDPKCIVYHNRWLTPQAMNRQTLSYARGEAACYGFYALHGHVFARQVLWNGLRSFLRAGSLRLIWAYAQGMAVAVWYRVFTF